MSFEPHLRTACSRTILQDGQSSVCYDADFYPFGGERVIANTCPQNYKFEGKERDTETNNDDFGARYYSSRLGRWLSADWSSVPAPVPYANLTNPQTLNLYAMVSDDPESFADLDGHLGVDPQHFLEGETAFSLFATTDFSDGLEGGLTQFDEKCAEMQQNLAILQQMNQRWLAGQIQPAQTTGRQPDGSYRAATGPGSEIGNILDPAHPSNPGPITSSSDPDGQCVTATRHFAKGLPSTRHWKAGQPVMIYVNGAWVINPAVQKDTAIATFDSNGRYPAGPHKNSGIFLGPALLGPPSSIGILDQWPGSPGPRPRDVSLNGGRGDWDVSNHSNSYYVITVR